jgi:hypothetical protein
LLSIEGEVEISVRVRNRTPAVGDKALSIIDLVDERSFAARRDEIFNEVGIVVV